jgi:signal transduction histidine kinase
MKRVLVVDDDEMYRKMVVSNLKQAGLSVLETSDGAKAIGLAQTNHIDLIICDVMMDKLDGFGVLERLHMDPSTCTIPFIFMTGLSDKESMRKGMTCGADDFLVKPFTATELMSAVEARLIKHQEMGDEAERKLAQLRTSISLALPHELCTPLTAILGFSEVVADENNGLSLAEIAYMGKSINESGLRLQRIVENFLIYAQIELIASDSRKVEVLRKCRLLDGSELIKLLSRKKAESYKRLADLTLELTEGPAAISGQYLTKICEELLDNAFKFSDAGTEVRVSTSNDRDEFILSIKDHGEGLSRQQVANVGAYMQFERKFYEHKGTGLGLTIAKRLTELHGGRMDIEVTTGHGTTVLVFLPQRSKKPSS